MSSTVVGILGGTFDPVHRAHLQLAKEACAELDLAQVLWVPSGNPPHREPPFASAQQRLAMVALAIANEPRFALDDSEVRCSAPSYTVTTLQRLREHYGATPLVLLLGADAFLGLATWHHWREIFALAHVAVATRPGYVLDPALMTTELREEYVQRTIPDGTRLKTQVAGSIVSFAISPLDISASQIRATLVADQETRQKAQDLLPKTVLDYIANNHLYSYYSAH
jgi:nicotinate-nucleotide adenylyltransferase